MTFATKSNRKQLFFASFIIDKGKVLGSSIVVVVVFFNSNFATTKEFNKHIISYFNLNLENIIYAMNFGDITWIIKQKIQIDEDQNIHQEEEQ